MHLYTSEWNVQNEQINNWLLIYSTIVCFYYSTLYAYIKGVLCVGLKISFEVMHLDIECTSMHLLIVLSVIQ